MKSFVGFLTIALAIARATNAQGTFNVLSMNVAGLPAILNGNGESGDKTTNTMLIGQACSLHNKLPAAINTTLCPVL